jgi:hypothetical protein
VEGTLLQPGWESFVGAGPLPMRHGLTMGELARWFIATLKLDVDCQVITMEGWEPDAAPGYGWPASERSWVNPSRDAGRLTAPGKVPRIYWSCGRMSTIVFSASFNASSSSIVIVFIIYSPVSVICKILFKK